MALEPVLAGSIPEDGIVGLLTEIEACRTTGVLRFESGDVCGEVRLVLGQISADQPERDDGQDAIELLLELRQGRFEVFQRLPPLPVSRGDEARKEGSLEVHIPADLMNYCERAGLTGVLALVHEEELRRAEILYDRGELTGIRLDGLEELNDVFGWESGAFRIESMARAVDFDAEIEELAQAPATEDDQQHEASKDERGDAHDQGEEDDEFDNAPTLRPEAPPPNAHDSTGKHFLRVVEVTLAEILREREQRRPATRTSPPLPPMSAPRKHPTLQPAALGDGAPKRKERKDQTVRVVYLGGAQVASPSGSSRTRHVRRGCTEETDLPAATRPSGSPPNVGAPTPPNAPRPAPQGAAVTLGWAAVAIAVVLASLGLLAMLPPLE